MQHRWAPTLPSFGGRLATRCLLSPEIFSGGYDEKLSAYYIQRSSCLGMFSHPVNISWIRKKGYLNLVKEGQAPRLEQLEPGVLYKYLLETFGNIRMSLNFQRKLSALCRAKDIATIKRWWQTTDGIVYPLLLSVANPDTCYADIDLLTKFSMENCANNYSHFLSRMKSLRRLLRKDYAMITRDAAQYSDLGTYWRLYKKYAPTDQCDPHAAVRYVLIWAQTRATGLADSKMIKKSLDKCEITLSTVRRDPVQSTPLTREYSYRGIPAGEPELPQDILSCVCKRVAARVSGSRAHISAGPNSCLESTRRKGGQTGYIKALARRKDSVTRVYDFDTLESVEVTPRPVRSQNDLLSWAINHALERPTHTRCVRLHSVAEPSKARTITVCSLPYLIIVGVMAKLLQPAIASDITRIGLEKSRGLWEFLWNDLDPNHGVWGQLMDSGPWDSPTFGLSCDLSEATDYGDLGVARQILSRLLEECGKLTGFPRGLAVLAKTLFIGKRYCLRHESGKGYRFFVKRNGWLMGDRITKVILTLAHEIVVISSGLHCARICGDDVVAFSRNKVPMEKYLEELVRLGFQVSWEDTFISPRLAFYCEEGCIPPTQYADLPSVCVRRKHQSMYIDYPRIRLLIPTCIETHAYSFTDVGRFSLLGKETRWVHQNGLTQVVPLFTRATLFQHLNVPEPADTLCPYLPIEIGGDGAFPPDGNFLIEVAKRKARSPSETCYRASALLTAKWGFRFLRSPNLNEVAHKYHLLIPKLDELRTLIPTDAIVEGNELLLNSIRVPGIEDPERTFFRLWRSFYWNTILSTGREPPRLRLDANRGFDAPHRGDGFSSEILQRFFERWRDSGFTFSDTPSYRVLSSKVHVEDYMNMGWVIGHSPGLSKDREDALSYLCDRKLLNEENIENFLSHLKNDTDLNPKVRDCLYKYVESDSYILWDLERKKSSADWITPRAVLLVSGDKKLAVKIKDLLTTRTETPWVFMCSPQDYILGHVSEFETYILQKIKFSDRPLRIIEDSGAINYAEATRGEFLYDGMIQPMVECRDVYHIPNGVHQLTLREGFTGTVNPFGDFPDTFGPRPPSTEDPGLHQVNLVADPANFLADLISWD